MATIPNAQSIERTINKPSEEIQRIDTSAAGKKSKIAADLLSGVAQDAKTVYDKDAEFELQNANAEMFTVFENAKQQFSNDTGFEDLEKRAGEAIQEAEKKVLEKVKNKSALAAFQKQQQENKLKFNSVVKGFAWEKEKSHYRAAFQKKMQDLGATVKSSDIVSMTEQAHNLSQTYVDKGYYKEDEMQQEIFNWTNDTALAGIDLLKPKEKIAALNEDWAVTNIEPKKRLAALEAAQKQSDDEDENLWALKAASEGKTKEQVLNIALQYKDPAKIAKIAKAADELYDSKKEAEKESENESFERMHNIVLNNLGDADEVFKSSEYFQLSADNQLKLRAAAERSKRGGVDASDREAMEHANDLILSGDYGAAKNFIKDNADISKKDQDILLDAINKNRAPDGAKDGELLDSMLGIVNSGSPEAKKRRAAQLEYLRRFRNDFVRDNQRQPTQPELDAEIMALGKKYTPDSLLPDILTRDQYIADSPIADIGKQIRDNELKATSEEYPDAFARAEMVYADEWDGMSHYKIKQKVEVIVKIETIKTQDQKGYAQAMDLIRRANISSGNKFHEVDDFFKAYNRIKSKEK